MRFTILCIAILFVIISLQCITSTHTTSTFITFAPSNDITTTTDDNGNEVKTISYHATAQITMNPFIPRSIVYYIQQKGHLEYDTAFEPDTMIYSSKYMGFELINNEIFQYHYHIEFHSEQIQYDTQITIDTYGQLIADSIQTKWEYFRRFLPTEQYRIITQSYANVTLTPMPQYCLPLTYLHPILNEPTTIYPCGQSLCRKCDSMDPCVKDKDCGYASSCDDNKCSMIANNYYDIFLFSQIYLVLMLFYVITIYML